MIYKNNFSNATNNVIVKQNRKRSLSISFSIIFIFTLLFAICLISSSYSAFSSKASSVGILAFESPPTSQSSYDQITLARGINKVFSNNTLTNENELTSLSNNLSTIVINKHSQQETAYFKLVLKFTNLHSEDEIYFQNPSFINIIGAQAQVLKCDNTNTNITVNAENNVLTFYSYNKNTTNLASLPLYSQIRLDAILCNLSSKLNITGGIIEATATVCSTADFTGGILKSSLTKYIVLDCIQAYKLDLVDGQAIMQTIFINSNELLPQKLDITSKLNNYKFKGFYSADNTQIYDNQGNRLVPLLVNQNISLYVKWNIEKPITIYLDQDGGTGGTTALFRKNASDTTTYSDISCETQIEKITIPTKTGYSFLGYFTNKASTFNPNDSTNSIAKQYIYNDGSFVSMFTDENLKIIQENTTLFARWAVNNQLTVSRNDATITLYTWDNTNKIWNTTNTHQQTNQYFISGNGEATTPYEISTPQELWNLSTLNKIGAKYSDTGFYTYLNYKLTNDIELNPVCNFSNISNSTVSGRTSWREIGNAKHANSVETGYNFFRGNFDGNGYVVSGIYINETLTTTGFAYGLFGRIEITADSPTNACVKNIGVINSYIKVTSSDSSLVGYAGGVVGASNASVINCYNTSTVDFTCTFAGTNTTASAGIMGNLLATNKSIENCFNSGTILGNNHIAGIAGYNHGIIKNSFNCGNINGIRHVAGISGYSVGTPSSVINCYNTGNITGTGGIVADMFYNHFGGIVAYNEGLVDNCYNQGDVFGHTCVGGIVGRNALKSLVADGIVQNSYNTGNISGGHKIGGIVGQNGGNHIDETTNTTGCIVNNCTNFGNISGNADIGGITGQNGLDGDTLSNINNSKNYGNISSKLNYDSSSVRVGGITGSNYSIINNCSNDGIISGIGMDYGGIAGKSIDNSYINSSFNNGFVTGTYSVGGIAGCLGSSSITATIISCHNAGKVVATSTCGGIAGYMYNNSKVLYCYNIAEIRARGFGTNEESRVGGLVGDAYYYSIIKNSYNTGNIYGITYVGGIIGTSFCGTGGIYNCYNTGNITSNVNSSNGLSNVAGIAGSNRGIIFNCFNLGNVTAVGRNVGGITGANWPMSTSNKDFAGKVINCYNNGTIIGYHNVAGISANCVGNVTDYKAEVKNCFNTGIILVGPANQGGIIGENYSTANEIMNNYCLTGTANALVGSVNNIGCSFFAFTNRATSLAITTNDANNGKTINEIMSNYASSNASTYSPCYAWQMTNYNGQNVCTFDFNTIYE